MGFEQLFDNLTFMHMDALRKQIQSLVDYVLSNCFWTHSVLSKFSLISTRGKTSFFHLGLIWGLWFRISQIFDL